MKAEIYKFADFELDSTKRALLKSGTAIPLNPKAFDLLVCLIERQDEILTKDDLINNVWNGQFIEENNITVQISAIRKVLGDDAKSSKFLRTIPGKGYKFIADVQIPDSDEIIFEKHSISKIILEEEETLEDSEVNNNSSKSPISQNKSKASPLVIFGFILVLLLTGFLVFQFWESTNQNSKYRLVKTEKLSSSGKVTNLALTPNSKYIVFSQQEGNGESLWLKHIETGGQQQIISPQNAKFVGLTVSPDGNFIYFSRFGNEAETYLEKISILGGVPEKISTIDSAVSVSFSPDGKQVAYTESHTAAGKTSLSISDIDGSNKKTMITANNDQRIFATYNSNPIAWSPNGDLIAVAVEEKDTAESSKMSILLVDPNDKSEKKLTKQSWKYAMELTWIDSNNLAFYGYEENENTGNIWVVSRNTRDSYKLTNDSNFYQRLSGNKGKLFAVKGNEISRIKIAEFRNDLTGFELKEIFNESGHIGNAIWGKDDFILYTSKSSGKNEVWQIHEEEKKPKQLTTNSNISGRISASAENNLMVFPAVKDGHSSLWITDLDGKNLKQLTSENKDGQANISANGESVIFQRGVANGKRTVWKINIKNKELKQITNQHTSFPKVSFDGKKTAYYFIDHRYDNQWRIGIVDNETKESLGKISFPVIVNQRTMAWHTENSFLSQVFYEGEDAKLLFLPINEDKHKIIPGFGKGEIVSLEWSKDGRKLLFSQVNEIRDVVSFEISIEK